MHTYGGIQLWAQFYAFKRVFKKNVICKFSQHYARFVLLTIQNCYELIKNGTIIF